MTLTDGVIQTKLREALENLRNNSGQPDIDGFGEPQKAYFEAIDLAEKALALKKEDVEKQAEALRDLYIWASNEETEKVPVYKNSARRKKLAAIQACREARL